MDHDNRARCLIVNAHRFHVFVLPLGISRLSSGKSGVWARDRAAQRESCVVRLAMGASGSADDRLLSPSLASQRFLFVVLTTVAGATECTQPSSQRFLWWRPGPRSARKPAGGPPAPGSCEPGTCLLPPSSGQRASVCGNQAPKLRNGPPFTAGENRGHEAPHG